MTEQTEIRKLGISEVDCVSGGAIRLDFGIVAIDFMTASIETGPMTGAWICGSNGCTSKIFGP